MSKVSQSPPKVKGAVPNRVSRTRQTADLRSEDGFDNLAVLHISDC